MLYGRLAEQTAIDTLLGRIRQGRSGSLVIVGEPGIGKTALLEYAAAHSDGMRVLRGTGVESEAELAFASLHLLLGPVLDRLGRLPDPQRTALSGALGLGPAGPGDRFLIALAVLSLLSELAEERPLVCLLDDVQWLDRASATALEFVARRLEGEGVAMLFATRDSGPAFGTPGVPEMRLSGLDSDASAALLAERMDERPAHPDREAILAQARGNPLALIELPAVSASGEPYDLPGLAPIPVTSRLQDVFGHQVRSLPAATQTLLLAAAANDTGDLAPLLRAGAALGTGIGDLACAEQSGLITLTTGKLVFRHPLVRAAIYHGAPRSQRMTVHSALADAFGETGDAARRAWHRAAATIETDEDVASDLEAAATSAAALGGHAAVAAACERAAQLSEDATAATRRLTLACEAAAMAGEPDRAVELAARAIDQADQAERANDRAVDPLLRARLSHVRGSAYFALGSLREAHAVLTAVAATITDDPVRAFWMLTEALHAAWQLPLDPAMLASTIDAFATLSLPDDHPLMSLVWLLRWCTAMPTGRDPGGFEPLADVIARAGTAGRSDGPRGLTEVAACALVVGRDAVAAEVTESLIADSRNRGIMGWLPAGLTYLATAEMCLGEHRSALVHGVEALRTAQDTGQHKWVNHASGPLAYLAALQGDERRCREYAGTAMAPLAADLAQPAAAWAQTALALLDLGLGRPEDAYRQFEALISGPARFMVGVVRSAPDHVEAAVRSGHPERAAAPLDRFAAWAAQMCQLWADALLARCRALTAPDTQAERHYETALKYHQDDSRPFDHARTQLVYGEWLRRMRRKNEAGAQLSAALATFSELDAGPWRDRALTELRASGAANASADARQRPDVFAVLTPQEFQIIQLAARGMSNRDIAAQLFLSTRTVAYHLYKAYPKLGIAGRTEIPGLLKS
ncbi:MAG: AAA family ATPase [Streptosporangiaceae bacterium]|nr:AAA family ATPase [Streptosporangiaceae bacterium]